MCLSVLLDVMKDFFSRLQTEAIHPDCALVVQHMKAEEECYQILKQEENNHSAKTGQPVF